MNAVLDWLDSPAPERGIHYYRNGGWHLSDYAGIASAARRTAAFLHANGVTKGVVSLLIEEPETFVPAFLGTMYAGATPSPIASPVAFGGHEAFTEHAAAVLGAAAPAAVLTDGRLAPLAGAACAKAGAGRPLVLPAPAGLPDADGLARRTAELALLQFTSGSSGTPKGVRVTGDNLTANVRAIHGWLGVTSEDSCSSWLPLYHDMGLIGTFLGSVVAQIDLWLMSPVDFIRSPARWLDCHGRHGVTITTAPNFGYGYATSRVRDEELENTDFSNWRVAMSGAERVDARVVADFTERLAPYGFDSRALTPCYGMAETTLAVTGVRPGVGARMVRPAGPLNTGVPVTVVGSGTLGLDRPEDAAGWIASCGTPVPGTAVDVVDDDGAPLPDGTFGEIRVRGTSVADGYESSDPAANRPFGEDGLRTGDAGFLLDGELYVVGRIGDSLKVRGRKVHAEDLEAALVSVPGVPPGRCAVALGARDGRPGAVIVVEAPGDGWLEAVTGTLRSALDTSVAVTVVRARRGTIPRTSSGKPRRRLLWRRAGEGTLAGDVLHSTHQHHHLTEPTAPTAPQLDGAAT
ncbi:AMP-binding protein [Streptomyces sp. M2CJ-2]|uniref:AMP-binding protein n=1 Tax=Streptomyces sp. M2CJ-2 TaxID=2803948 RepID=UPI0019279C4A|nr:AMP-binding protein [Streptomyces sp. M2CJ-2]MBL3668014.1 AMP-binding protein [Streptomyces sp. M2CJ-2]